MYCKMVDSSVENIDKHINTNAAMDTHLTDDKSELETAQNNIKELEDYLKYIQTPDFLIIQQNKLNELNKKLNKNKKKQNTSTDTT